MSPHEALGLAEDADERAIKRAYAVRLRHTRPDDDPDAFQALHSAYQAALELCRRAQAVGTVAVAATAPAPAPAIAAPRAAPTPAIAPVPIRFDLPAFVEDALAHAHAGDALALKTWLCGIEALWSLDVKARTGRVLMTEIYRRAPPMPEPCMAALLSFFDLDHTLAGHDPLALHRLKRRTALAWQLEPAQRGELAYTLQMRLRPQRRKLDRALRQLQRPFRWPQVLLSGLLPNFVRGVAQLVQRLCAGQADLLPASIDRRQVAFWLAAADGHRVSRPRLALAGARTLAALFLSLPVGMLMGLIANGPSGVLDPGALGITLAIAAGLCALVFLVAAWWQLVRWQFQPAAGGPWQRRLHAGLVPLLAGAGLALEAASEAPMVGWPFLVPAIWLGLGRALRHSGGLAHRWIRIALFMGVPLLRVMAGNGLQPKALSATMALTALAAWGFDLWRQRARREPGFG